MTAGTYTHSEQGAATRAGRTPCVADSAITEQEHLQPARGLRESAAKRLALCSTAEAAADVQNSEVAARGGRRAAAEGAEDSGQADGRVAGPRAAQTQSAERGVAAERSGERLRSLWPAKLCAGKMELSEGRIRAQRSEKRPCSVGQRQTDVSGAEWSAARHHTAEGADCDKKEHSAPIEGSEVVATEVEGPQARAAGLEQGGNVQRTCARDPAVWKAQRG